MYQIRYIAYFEVCGYQSIVIIYTLVGSEFMIQTIQYS